MKDEELDMLIANVEYEPQQLKDYITNLQEENEKLKDYLKIMEKGKDNNLNRFLDYKTRCEKAIEKLESIRTFGLRSGKTLFSTLINESIDILNGGDEE